MKKTTLLFTALIAVFIAKANNVQVANVFTTGQNTTTQFVQVAFDISWANSWRTSSNENNYDGAWVFVKYRKMGTTAWLHATLANTGSVSPTGSTIQATADGKGAFIYRSADGVGTVNFTGGQLRWTYGVDGVLNTDVVEVRLFAAEMALVPQGSFYLGSNVDDGGSFRDGALLNYFQITSESSLTVNTTSGNLYSTSPSLLANGTIPDEYPKGFKGFWCLKYEFSRQQYLDFLNNLDQSSANNRNAIGATGLVPNMLTTNGERAANGFNYLDIAAWLDWAALRPITEMEFEKANRGRNNIPLAGEYAWGNSTGSQTTISTGSNIGLQDEQWTNGNINLSPSVGPMRCGALATSSSNRQQSGATYYGIMEMSGNVNEPVINANTGGRTYTGQHGNGVLNGVGDADVATWPAATGYGRRGGSYAEAEVSARVSNRSFILDVATYNTRTALLGGRGVRTAE